MIAVLGSSAALSAVLEPETAIMEVPPYKQGRTGDNHRYQCDKDAAGNWAPEKKAFVGAMDTVDGRGSCAASHPTRFSSNES